MSDVAISAGLLALVAVIGLWLGNIEVRKVGLGIGGVLFGGIFVGHFVHQQGVVLDVNTLHFVQEFGLILFVYSIGIQVGPGFFSSLRQSGLRLNALAALLVVLACAVATVLHKALGVPLPVILGILSGAVTNTPSLGAGQQILTELGSSPQSISAMGMAYAVAYPFGICGVLLSMWLLRQAFKVDIAREAQQFDHESGLAKAGLSTLNVALRNTNLAGLALSELPVLAVGKVICSRLKRGDMLFAPNPGTLLQLGDLLHLVGEQAHVRRAQLAIGDEVTTSLSTQGTDLRVERVVLTNVHLMGKRIGDLALQQSFDVVISRLNRAGVELVPEDQITLQFGDILNLVGAPDAINAVAAMMGNAQHKLQQVQMLPVFIGIGLGVLLGSVPFYVPGFPAALKLGLAGGPLVVALILSRIGSIGTLHWFMPPSANLALRELGIVLFLSVVGLKSGGQFLDTLTDGPGLSWMAYGMLITLVPLLTVGFLARAFGKLNYLSLCGLLAGSMTDPPALAFANAMHPTSGAAALSYVTVYPMVMFLRIIAPQLLALMLWV